MASWDVNDIHLPAGRAVMITGTGGLALHAALALVRAGCAVTLLGRSLNKGASALAMVRAAHPAGSVEFEHVDLASLASIESFAGRMIAGHREVDVLINNAGVMAPPLRKLTADGFELQSGTNFLGHFALTARLAPLLRRGRAARVINVSSIAHKRGMLDFADLQSAKHYGAMAAYRQSKLANLMFSFELQRRSDAGGWGVASIACHPGVATTDLFLTAAGPHTLRWLAFRVLSPFLFQSAAAGALPLVYAAASPDAKSGGYYGPDGFMELKGAPTVARIAVQAEDPRAAARLWQEAERLTQVAFAA